jgi:hypothetical protein
MAYLDCPERNNVGSNEEAERAQSSGSEFLAAPDAQRHDGCEPDN